MSFVLNSPPTSIEFIENFTHNQESIEQIFVLDLNNQLEANLTSTTNTIDDDESACVGSNSIAKENYKTDIEPGVQTSTTQHGQQHCRTASAFKKQYSTTWTHESMWPI
jgi:hypothetical protein